MPGQPAGRSSKSRHALNPGRKPEANFLPSRDESHAGVIPVADEDGRGFRIASAYVSVGLDQTGLDVGISDVESKLAGIRDRAIGIGLDPAAVDAAVREIQARHGGSAGAACPRRNSTKPSRGSRRSLPRSAPITSRSASGQSGAGQLTGLAAVVRMVEQVAARSAPLRTCATRAVAVLNSRGPRYRGRPLGGARRRGPAEDLRSLLDGPGRPPRTSGSPTPSAPRTPRTPTG